MFNQIFVIMAACGMTIIVNEGEIFNFVRQFLLRNGNGRGAAFRFLASFLKLIGQHQNEAKAKDCFSWILQGMGCGVCAGFWCGAFVELIMSFYKCPIIPGVPTLILCFLTGLCVSFSMWLKGAIVE